jgi:hypothetical protein
MGSVPIWDSEIVSQVCLEHNRSIPEIICRQSRKIPDTSGSMSRTKNRIVVTFGTRGHDHRQTLLHELAHYLNPKGWHGKEFYLILKSLLVKYDCLTEEYKQRQYRYIKRSRLYL